jgi:hypothetical protein
MSFMNEALSEIKARDVVRRILEGSVEVQTLYSDSRGCLGINGALACSDEGETIRKELVARRNASELALRRRLQRARQEGDLPRSADCAMLASYITTVNQGLAVQAKAGASKATLRSIVEHVLATWPSSKRDPE